MWTWVLLPVLAVISTVVLICLVLVIRFKIKENSFSDYYGPNRESLPDSTKDVGILSLNTCLIWPNINVLDPAAERAMIIANWIENELPTQDISFVLFQEVFVPYWADVIYRAFKQIGWSYIVPRKGSIYSNGLITASYYKIRKKVSRQFDSCKGMDCLASKGFTYILSRKTLICNVHLQDDVFDPDRNVRHKQLTSIFKSVRKSNAKRIAITGDFNLTATEMRDFLLQYPEFRVHSVNEDDIDYIVLSGFHLKSVEFLKKFDGVSDHRAFLARID